MFVRVRVRVLQPGERKVPGSVRFHDSVRGSSSSSSHDDEDPMLRVMSQPDEIAPEEFIANISSHHDTTNLSGISHRLSSSSGRDLSNLSLLSDSDVLVLGESSSSSISRGNSAQKRRRYVRHIYSQCFRFEWRRFILAMKM